MAEKKVDKLVVWLTGLSGAGKSTLATRTASTLQKHHLNCLILDGDEIRKRLHPHFGFSRADILEHNRRIIQYCAKQLPLYDCIIVAVIAPFHQIRSLARETLGSNYIEVYVECSLEEVIRRDVKGLYQKALRGEIENFIGLSKNVPYEIPLTPDLKINTEQDDIDHCHSRLLGYLQERFSF